MTGQPISRLTLGRYLTGELDTDEAQQVAAAVAEDPLLQAHLDRVESARSRVAPFDAAAIRARAMPATGGALDTPQAANDNRAFLAVIPLLLAAAVALFFFVPSVEQADDPVLGIRGASVLEVYHLEPSGLARYDERALGAGDVVGFKVDPGTHDSVVVLSVDARGTVSVYYPEQGDAPQHLDGSGLQALPGSVILDDAPGPEVFVAVFDKSVSQAKGEAQRAFQAGGTRGLADWASAAAVDLTVVNKK